MRGLRILGDRRAELATLPRPESRDGWAVVRSTMSAVCGSDLQKLKELRWFGDPMPDFRDRWMFVAGVGMSWLAVPPVLQRELFALAREVGGWTEGRTRSKLQAVFRTSREAAAGKRVEWAGVDWDPRYRLKNQTIIEWLEMTLHPRKALPLQGSRSPDRRQDQDEADLGALGRDSQARLLRQRRHRQRLPDPLQARLLSEKERTRLGAQGDRQDRAHPLRAGVAEVPGPQAQGHRGPQQGRGPQRPRSRRLLQPPRRDARPLPRGPDAPRQRPQPNLRRRLAVEHNLYRQGRPDAAQPGSPRNGRAPEASLPSRMGAHSPHRRLPLEPRSASAGQPSPATRLSAEPQATTRSKLVVFDTFCYLLSVQNSRSVLKNVSLGHGEMVDRK